jgi:ABC-type uncharacterized transport system YnjBCD permease subunit
VSRDLYFHDNDSAEKYEPSLLLGKIEITTLKKGVAVSVETQRGVTEDLSVFRTLLLLALFSLALIRNFSAFK